MECHYYSCSNKVAKYNVGKCKLCKQNFCGKHRLPKTHTCNKETQYKEELRKKHMLDLLNDKTITPKLNVID
jgi:small subunit ribosomal protein S27Ae